MQEHFNQLTPAEHERLSVLFEEASEVIQVVGKIMRHGYESRHPDGGPTNRELLEKEIGDVYAAITLIHQSGDVAHAKLRTYQSLKLDKIGRYLHHQD